MPRNILYQNDYNWGTYKETVILPNIRKYFNKDIIQSPDKFAKHDFFDNETNYEVKSRTNSYRHYPTTMITCDKLIGEKKLILLFNFTDGLYYIEYDEEKFKKYQRKLFSRANISWNEKEHIYIDINDLTKI